jgi:sensor histidine kinase YesM
MPMLTVLCVLIQPAARPSGLFVTSAICTIFLEMLLSANAYYQRRMRQGAWMRKIGLDKAVLISLLLISVILSAMAVSSLHDPAYHTKDRLLIGYEFSPGKILAHFGTFLAFIAQFLFMYLCGYLLYYLNSRWLVAKVLKQQGIMLYALSVLAMVAFLYPVLGQLLIWLPVNRVLGGMFRDDPFVFENAFSALAIILSTLPVVLAMQWAKQNNRIVSLEKEKSTTELEMLKQQLNPHFFFNTLNNLYALSLQQSSQTAESILRLSELMRYVIYKGQEAQVDISDEIKYVEDYIQLQQIRLRKKPDLQFTKQLSAETMQVAPLLLIVFVENAFKHGIEPAEERAYLHLHLSCSSRQLYFSCENSFEGAAPEQGGIGLSNLRKRLALLYPGQHALKTAVKNHTFKAEMQLDLS